MSIKTIEYVFFTKFSDLRYFMAFLNIACKYQAWVEALANWYLDVFELPAHSIQGFIKNRKCLCEIFKVAA